MADITQLLSEMLCGAESLEGDAEIVETNPMPERSEIGLTFGDGRSVVLRVVWDAED